jgi:hypothetical protein
LSRALCDRVRDAGWPGFHSLIGYVRATLLLDLVDAVGIGTGLAIMGVPLALPPGNAGIQCRHDDSAARLSREVDRVLEEACARLLLNSSSSSRCSARPVWKPVMPAYRRRQRWQVTALPAVDLPAPGLGRAETPIEQLYLGSATLPEAACTACAAATPHWPHGPVTVCATGRGAG